MNRIRIGCGVRFISERAANRDVAFSFFRRLHTDVMRFLGQPVAASDRRVLTWVPLYRLMTFFGESVSHHLAALNV